MFEQKINETIAYLSENSIGNQQSLTLRQIFASSMPDSMKKIFEVEVRQWVEEEKKRLLDSPHFEYSEDEILQLFDQIVFKAVEYASFSKAEFDDTLDRSVKLLYNYLCRPQWTMRKYVFADRDNATADSVLESLQYFRDYEYYKLILAEYFDKKQLDVINAKKFENLIENIDEEIVRTFDSRKMARLTEPIFSLFNIGDESSEPRIPIEAASIFFDDKNITSVVERLDSEKNKTDTLTLHDLTMLIGEVDFTMSLDISHILTQHAGQLEGLPDVDTNMGRDFDVPDIEDDRIEESIGVLDVPDIMDSEEDDAIAQTVADDIPVIEETDGEEVVLSRDNDFEFDDTYDSGLQSEDDMDTGEFQEYDSDQDGITLPQDVVLEEEIPEEGEDIPEMQEGIPEVQEGIPEVQEGIPEVQEDIPEAQGEISGDFEQEDQTEFQDDLTDTTGDEFRTEEEDLSTLDDLPETDSSLEMDDLPVTDGFPEADDLSTLDDDPIADHVNLADGDPIEDHIDSADDDHFPASDVGLVSLDDDIDLQDEENTGELYEDDILEQEHGDTDLADLDEVELPDIVLNADALDGGALDADIMLEEDLQALEEDLPAEDEEAELNAEDIFKELELDSLEDLGNEAEAGEAEAGEAEAGEAEAGEAEAGETATQVPSAAGNDSASTPGKTEDAGDKITKEEVISTYGDIHARIAASDKKKYVKRLFGKNADALESAIDTLNGKATWREASEYIDELFIKYEVDMYSRVATRFSDDIYKRYLNKKS